ncbi:MAG: methionine--tRNA ligase [Rickettsiales bacterium]|jgi:methionyl-tRNA synthetase|nr:methionine--tRNA ligase [Rickettsiales bacterium]
MPRKILITSALPYVNGELHLGHLVGCWLPADAYARFCRARGDDVLFVCGADEHGTPSIVGAAKENMPVLEYNNKWLERQIASMNAFNLSLDLYGRTHTELQTKLVQSLFTKLDERGLIEERETVQPFGIDDNMFLADRQLVGTCPRCGHDKARGDECPACAAAYEIDELKNPRSAISGGRVEMRPTKNLFFLASKLEGEWREWLASHAPKWSKAAAAIADGWKNEGLRDTSITRDLPWGIPVNKPGYESKVFYVWFDAPWGYVSISQAASPDWASWWKNKDARYAQFMGKDNVKFHSVFFPEQQLAVRDNWKTVDMLKAMNFLTFEGGKFSKSDRRGVFMDQALADAPADCWRYALLASAPETDDSDFSIRRFADIVNKDLNGVLGNFVSRVCKLAKKTFGLKVPRSGATDAALAKKINRGLAELTQALDDCEFRRAVEALRELWATGNEFLSEAAPWNLIKNGREAEAATAASECFQLIDFYARVSSPFIPAAAEKMRGVFGGGNRRDLSWPKSYEHRIEEGESFSVPENIFSRIDEDKMVAMSEKYLGGMTPPPVNPF